MESNYSLNLIGSSFGWNAKIGTFSYGLGIDLFHGMSQQVGKCGSNDTNGHNYDKQYPPTIEIEF